MEIIRDQLCEVNDLAEKLKVIGEYLEVMKVDEMSNEDHNQYHFIGGTIYDTALEIKKIAKNIFEDPALEIIGGGMKQAS